MMLTNPSDRKLVTAVQKATRPLTGAATDYDALLDLVGDARFCLLGEASHGTHEFYRERAQITKRLIKEKNFTAVAVEADWPDAYRVNRFVRGASDDQEAVDALEGFKRFPTWMWRNSDVLDFVGWLREYNDDLPADSMKTGFYGLDLYSLHTSMQAVLAYLDKVDPEVAKRARYRYSCFDHFGEDAQAYGYQAGFGLTESCEKEVIEQLVELRRRAPDYSRRHGFVGEDEFFFAEQNALVVKDAEQYYRTMFQGRISSWNLRDQHMVRTLDALEKHLAQQGQRPKIVVWEHNSHLGDARSTQMGASGEVNVGQLVREEHGNEAVLIGFSTYHGTVTAASDWDGAAGRKRVRDALPESYESIFHEVQQPRLMINLREESEAQAFLREPRLERAIGVIYRPETERPSHYFYASLPDQFDALLHFDRTRAVEPLERTAVWEHEEVPETFPYGV